MVDSTRQYGAPKLASQLVERATAKVHGWSAMVQQPGCDDIYTKSGANAQQSDCVGFVQHTILHCTWPRGTLKTTVHYEMIVNWLLSSPLYPPAPPLCLPPHAAWTAA